MRLTPAGALVLVAFSVPVAIELRTLFGIFGVALPLASVVVFEAVLLAAIAVAYVASSDSDADAAAKH
ncbi:CbaC protein [Halorussus litoreus]|uniref:CbaC protein n=1 Tax=Halorussus litoreus TaxID=1710536 RepID=UPI000E21D8DF|nr:CbaC protein [Halorussus litoreus]